MNLLTTVYVKLRERRAQSMTEYALIMAAIAVVAYAAYQTLGNQISTLVNTVTGKL